MPRKPSLVDEQSIVLLRKYIQKKVSLQCVSFAEIQQLQSQIKKETGEYLSVQTLNRFFGLIKNDFKPAQVTLNILAQYLHYDSFKEFELAHKKQQVHLPVTSVSPELIRLLFVNVEVDRWNDKSLASIMRNICLMLKKYPHMAEEVCTFMATTDYGRRCFYERFINMDALDCYYGDGLKYYITQTKDREQLFFAYSLLAFRYFLTLRYDLFNYYYNKILEYSIEEILAFSPSLVGRYFACQVLNSILNNEAVEVYEEATAVFKWLKQSAVESEGLQSASSHFAEALILAQEYEMAWEVLRESHKQEPLLTQSQKAHSAEYELLELYAGWFSKKIHERRAVNQLEALQKHRFYFLSQDFYTFFLLRLSLALGLKDASKTAPVQWGNLVEKTGFLYFRNGLMLTSSESVVLMENKGKKFG